MSLTSTSVKGANITTYTWMDNGNQICSSSPSCVYAFNVGSNAVTLTIVDANGGTSTTQGYVNVIVASSAPVVTTSPATSVTSNTATVVGSVNPNGADTSVWFQYSLNSSMASSTGTSPFDIGSGNAAISVGANLSGLSSNATYYYQVWAGNSSGTVHGFVGSFTTAAVSGPHLTLSVSPVGSFSLGEGGAKLTLTVTNVGTGSLAGAFVTVDDTLPASFQIATQAGLNPQGTGWTCAVPDTGPPNCTRYDSLAPGASYPPITIQFIVSYSAPPTVTNVSSVSVAPTDQPQLSSLQDEETTTFSVAPAQSTNGYIIKTIAGTLGQGGYSGDGGPASAALLSYPESVTLDSTGNIYFVDGTNVVIRKIDANGIISTVAGSGTTGNSGDGQAATSAQFNQPNGVAVDSAGNLYIADSYNYRVRKVANGIIYLFAGTGSYGDSGDNGLADSAELKFPWGVATDSNNNVYIADQQDNKIRKVMSSTGIITTVAGTGTAGYSGDRGPAISAQIRTPYGLATDSTGDLLIADFGNQVIRDVSSNGIITTIAGCGECSFYPDGPMSGPATSNSARAKGVASDSNGVIYIADTSDSVIRSVTWNGTTYWMDIIAGTGFGGAWIDGMSATATQLWSPNSVAVDAAGRVYFADNQNEAIGVLLPAGHVPSLAITSSHGAFSEGQLGATYTLIVTNDTSASATSGMVSVQEVLPPGLTLVSMAGSGWICASGTCTQSDPLAAGAGYSPITVTVNVAATAALSVVNRASVSGGGSLAVWASDPTVIIAIPPALTILLSHSGNLTQGQASAAYSISLSNSAQAGPTSGAVTVTDTLPAGLTLVAMSGTGWTCQAGAVTCTRSDTLAAGDAYPPVTVTVNVAANASSPQANQVTVSGGGSASASATDFTVISALTSSVTVQTSPPGLQFSVDGGTPKIAPQTLYLPAGSHTIAVATTQADGTGTQYLFTSWSDGGAASHSITVGSTAATYTAIFQTQYQLTILTSPSAGGTVTPASGTLYNAGTVVAISATPNAGYTFAGWTAMLQVPSAHRLQ